MGFKETLHNLIHQEEYHHYPLPEELEEGGLVAGALQDMEEGIQYDIRTQNLQHASDSLEEFLEEDLE